MPAAEASTTVQYLEVGQVGYASVIAWMADPEWDMWLFKGLRVYSEHAAHLNMRVERTDEGLVCELLQRSSLQRHPSTEITPDQHLPVVYLVVDGVKHSKVPQHLRIQLP